MVWSGIIWSGIFTNSLRMDGHFTHLDETAIIQTLAETARLAEVAAAAADTTNETTTA